MRNVARIFIIEEDPYASEWMAMLLARDWRAVVVGTSLTIDNAVRQLKSRSGRIDLILLDADFLGTDSMRLLKNSLGKQLNTRILIIGNSPSEKSLRLACSQDIVAGYVIKSEINHSLGWAIGFAVDQSWVSSPGIHSLATSLGLLLPDTALILDGRCTISPLTPRELEVARLALIFSMERRELAKEIGVTEDWGYGLVRLLYKKLGMEELLTGEVPAESYLGNSPVILERLRTIIAELKSSTKGKDMESLAFHLLTMPEISN